jgi:signal transduction histidine kinase
MKNIFLKVKKFWLFLSFLGLQNRNTSLEKKGIVIANQLNIVMLVIMVLLSIISATVRHFDHRPIEMGSWRLLLILLVNIINILLAKKSHFTALKISLIFVPVFIFFILTTLTGFVEEESYYYYPYVIIAFSLFPQLILAPYKETAIYYTALAYFLVLVMISDNLLSYYAETPLKASESIKEFYFYYKLVPFIVFVFLHLSISYLRNINFNFEKEIIAYNEELNATIEELKVTQQHLVQSEKMASIATLISGMAHEMNNPLNFINGGMQFFSDIKEEIKNHMPQEMQKKYELATKMTLEGLERVSGIVNSLMIFSQSEKFSLVNSNLNLLLDNILQFFNLKDYHIQIKKTYLLKDMVKIFPNKISQAVIIILDNAVYSLKQSSITDKVISISTRAKEKNVQIEISNNGPPILEKDINKIFDPFFTTKAPGKGIGLGLSIAYSLIEEHKGIIKVQNTMDAVSFVIELPKNSE